MHTNEKTYKKTQSIYAYIIGFIIPLIGLLVSSRGNIHITGEYISPISQKSSFSQSQILDINTLEEIDGVLLLGPSPTLYKQRAHTMIAPSNTFKGRVYQVSHKDIIDGLVKMSTGSGDYRMIIENNIYKQYRNRFKDFVDRMGNQMIIRDDTHLGTKYNHAKVFITDKYTSIQTANLTHSAFTTNIEHFFLTQNIGVHTAMTQLFEQDRDQGFDGSLGLHQNLIVCPYNCRDIIEFMIDNAQTSIYMMQQYIDDTSIAGLLRQKESLDIRILLPDNANNQKRLGIRDQNKIRLLKKPYIHSKTILIDDRYLIVGSMNMSTNSLDNNREIGIILTKQGHINAWKQHFMQYWIDAKTNIKAE